MRVHFNNGHASDTVKFVANNVRAVRAGQCDCIDNDVDGYGENCSAGPDCDDTDSFYNDICPTCTVKIIPATLGLLIGDNERTRTLFIVGERGVNFEDSPAIKWESDAIEVVWSGKLFHRTMFMRFMFMRVTFNGEPLDKQEYRVLIGDCEGSIKWVR